MQAYVRDIKIHLKKSILYIMSPPCKYVNDEERIKAYREKQNKYAMQDWVCEICHCVIKLGNKTKHQNSLKHFNRANGTYTRAREDQQWKCEACDIKIHIHSKENHLKSARHIRNSNKLENSDSQSEESENSKE